MYRASRLASPRMILAHAISCCGGEKEGDDKFFNSPSLARLLFCLAALALLRLLNLLHDASCVCVCVSLSLTHALSLSLSLFLSLLTKTTGIIDIYCTRWCDSSSRRARDAGWLLPSIYLSISLNVMYTIIIEYVYKVFVCLSMLCVYLCVCMYMCLYSCKSCVCVCIYSRPAPDEKRRLTAGFLTSTVSLYLSVFFFCSVYARVILLFLPFSDLSVVVLVVVVVVFTRVVAVLKSVKTYRRSCLGGPTHRRLILLDAHAAYFCYGRFLLAGIVVIIVIPLNARFDYRRLFGRLFF